MNYRSFADLDACITRNLWRIPADVDLIVGVPRSGLLAATMLALHLNLPLADLEGLLQNRLLSAGFRLREDRQSTCASARRIAVIDDSVATGAEMRRTRAKLQGTEYERRVFFAAVYVTEQSANCVDVYFEICPAPRTFTWNLMHRPILADACMDIDGVLCEDPTEEENDDGPRYRDFLAGARALLRPSYEVGALVTCRLEKYRPETERWLKAHGVRYRELVMWDLPDKAARLASRGHGDFKAAVFRSRAACEFFIESSGQQAQRIADLASKPVICIETQRVHLPDARALGALVRGAAAKSPIWMPNAVRRLFLSIRAYLVRVPGARVLVRRVAGKSPMWMLRRLFLWLRPYLVRMNVTH